MNHLGLFFHHENYHVYPLTISHIVFSSKQSSHTITNKVNQIHDTKKGQRGIEYSLL